MLLISNKIVDTDVGVVVVVFLLVNVVINFVVVVVVVVGVWAYYKNFRDLKEMFYLISVMYRAFSAEYFIC